MTRVLVLLFTLVLGACGGGGGDAAPPAITLSGVAATGAGISGRIFIKDAAGHEQWVDTADGRFSFALTDLTAPFMLKAQWNAGGSTHTLYSLCASAAGGTANITPLTQLAVATAAGVTLAVWGVDSY